VRAGNEDRIAGHIVAESATAAAGVGDGDRASRKTGPVSIPARLPYAATPVNSRGTLWSTSS